MITNGVTTVTFKLKLLTTLIASSLYGSFAINAQETTDENLEIIQVSAQKRQQGIQDVPISMSAFDEKSIERMGATDFVGLTAVMPSINVQTGSGAYPVTYIRGIGTNDTSIGADPSIGVYIDGVYASRLSGALTDFLDVERVEVLRGPQGTLFGRNSIGGAISIITKKPDYEFGGSLALESGSFGLTKANAVVNIPLSEDKLALRVYASKADRDGWQNNTLAPELKGGKQDRTNFGFKVLWEPTKDVDVTMSNTWSEFDDISTYVDNLTYLLPWPVSDLTNKTDDDRVVNGNVNIFGVAAFDRPVTAPVFERELNEHWIDVEWALSDDITFNSLTTYREFDVFTMREYDGTEYMIAENGGASETNTSFSQEFRLTSDTDNMFWVLGASYLEEEAYLDLFLNALDIGVLLSGTPLNDFETFTERSTTQVDTQSFALFGDVNFKLSEATSITLGARYSKDDKDSSYLNGLNPDGLNAFGGFGLIYPTPFQFVDDQGVYDPTATVSSNSWNDVSPRLVIDHKVNDVLYYASVTKGYKSGAFNSFPAPSMTTLMVAPGARESVDPEKVINYEVGIKSTLLDDSLILNASYYHMDYSELQVFQVDQTVTKLVNAGSAKSAGVEVDGRYFMTDSLDLVFNATYMDTEFDEYVNGGIDYAGTPLLNSPKLSGSMTLDYEKDMFNGFVNAFITYSYKAKHLLANDYEQDSYSQINANLSYTTLDENWEFSLYGKNLTDEVFFTQMSDNVKSFGARGVVRNEPRSYGVKVRYNF